MRLLLDTHIWIWSYLEPHRITSEIARQLINPENENFLSPVSVWEVLVLLERKRIRISEDFEEWFKKSKQDLDLLEAPFAWEVAHELRFVRLGHKDPADHFLVATARVYDLTLITADARLMNIAGVNVLPNR